MRKILIALIFGLFGLTTQVNAQTYNTAVGLRGGLFSGVTIKHFISDNAAVEGILANRWGGIAIIGLYEIQMNLPTEGLSWYYGGGAHLATYKRVKYYSSDATVRDGNVTTVGIDGIIGLEYNFADFPLNLSLDAKPFFELINGNSQFLDIALSARYYF
jgi:hypothetical protein